MQASKHYGKASITEALIDLRVEVLPHERLSALKDLQGAVKEDYVLREDILTYVAQLEGGQRVSAAASQTPVGYIFSSSDRKQILQARLDGFTFSRLAPYDRWETFRKEARRLWDIYQSAAQPESITRVAVRYINRLDLPLPFDDFKDYLRTLPEVSPDLSQGLSNYFMQLQIPQEDLGGLLVLNQALLPPPQDEEVVSILLDIDLFCESKSSGDGSMVWDLLEQMRIRKNEVFEACITDKTRSVLE